MIIKKCKKISYVMAFERFSSRGQACLSPTLENSCNFLKYQKFFTRLRDNRGSILLTTYMVITVLMLLGTAFLVASTNESRSSNAQQKIVQAFFAAEAGIERAMYDIRQDFVSASGTPSLTDGDINGMAIGPNTGSYYSVPYGTAAGDESEKLNDGSYSVSLKNVSGADDIWIKSTGTVGSISQTMEVYAQVISISPWDNAIFGGAGSSGSMVNGNVDIRGSVHILGNGLADGDPAILMGGTAEIVGNNYKGMPSDLEDRVPGLPTTIVTGESTLSETLNAELRVRKGTVSLSGSAAVGEDTQPGDVEDGEKENVDGVYVTDGFAGTKGADNVYSDNLTDQAYDLGDAVSFPSLNDDIGVYSSYYDYFNAEAYTLTAGEMTTVADLTDATPDFTYGDCSGSNCISMTGGQLYMKGKVYVNGGTLGVSGGEIIYTGSGTILVTGNVNINENLVTPIASRDAEDDPIPNFPYDASLSQSNVLGVMTPGNIDIGTGAGASQLDVMGLFYSEGTVTTAKQTDFVGTIVTNYFNVSSQVPSVYQVPGISSHLPSGMIDGDEVWILNVVSWQKI